MLDDIIRERAKKKEALESAGLNVYPSRVKRTADIAGVLKKFDTFVEQKKDVFVVGRIVAMRGQGAITFIDLRDASGKMQALLKEDITKDYTLIRENLDIGDFLEVHGLATVTQRGEKSIAVQGARVITKSLRPLPSMWHGLQDVEERYRKRYLDFLLNDEARERVVQRTLIVAKLRAALMKQGFMEVETPMLQPIPGGALARPFVTHHNALDVDFYLRIAPELYLKRLLVGGFDKIFEIGRNFRNEGMDRDHNPEFTALELYWAYQDYKGLMKFTEKLLKPFIKGEWETMTFADLIQKHTGKKWSDIPADALDETYKREIRMAGKLEKNTFVTEYPTRMMPLAKFKGKGGKLTESFQLIAGTQSGAVGGPEIVKGFSEMNNPLAQRAQMEEQEARHRGGNEEEGRLDEDFIEALEYGMPPAAGLGIGIDRLVAIATGAHAVKEVILFPTLKPKSHE